MNVTLFLVMLAFGAGLNGDNSQVHLSFGANYGPLTWNGQEWRLLAAAFIHFGVIHLAFNMFALYNGGIWTERLYGSTRFAVIYLLSALAGSVVSGWWDPTRMSAGASGAVFGVYGALLAFFARRPRDIRSTCSSVWPRARLRCCCIRCSWAPSCPSWTIQPTWEEC
jgi:rhomboid protease GluP